MSDFGSPSFGQDDPFAPKQPNPSSAETVFNGAQQPDSFGSDIPPVSVPDSFSGGIPAGVSAETPKKKNKTLWIILIVVALLLCCCCIVLVIIGASSYQDLNLEDMLDEFSLFSPFIANII